MLKHVLYKVLLAFLCCASVLEADEPAQEEATSHVISLPSGTVHNGDFFAVGNLVEISGQVNGDVYVLASQVVIDGVVNGDVLLAAGSVDISGTVTSNARILAGQTSVSGKIGRNVTLLAGNAQLFTSGSIGGNLVCLAGNADLGSTIGYDATIAASNVRVSNAIKHNLDAYVGQMRLTSRASVQGNVEYSSSNSAYFDPKAQVKGEVIHHPSMIKDLFQGEWLQGLVIGSKIATFLMNYLYCLVVGLLLIKLFPKNLEITLNVLYHRPWASLIYGITLMIVLPLASLILLMTILGAPFALTLLALNVISFYTAKIFSILAVSHLFFSKFNVKLSQVLTLVFGLLIYFSLTLIPIFGTALAIAAMLFGLGASILAQIPKKRVFILQ